jgi:serine O-acetyltransferase
VAFIAGRGFPGRVTHKDGRRVSDGIDLNMTDLPDPVARAMQCVLERLQGMEDEVTRLRRELDRARASAGQTRSIQVPVETIAPD